MDGPMGFCFLDAAKGEHTDYFDLVAPPFVASARPDRRFDVVVLGVGKAS